MNKTELIDAIAAQTGLSKKDAESALNAYTAIVTKALKEDDKVTLVGFGTFEVRQRAARTGKNPQIPAFKPSKGLKDTINGVKK